MCNLGVTRLRDESVLIGPIIGSVELRNELELALIDRTLAHPGGLLAENLPAILEVLAATIKSTVIDVRGGKVRLGTEAPRNIKVIREELVRHPYVAGSRR